MGQPHVSPGAFCQYRGILLSCRGPWGHSLLTTEGPPKKIPTCCKDNYSLPPTIRPMPIQSFSNNYLAEKSSPLLPFTTLSSFPIFITPHDVTWWGIPLWPIQVSCPTHVSSQLCALALPTCCLTEWEKTWLLCKHCSETAKLWCIINTVLATNLKLSSI